MERYLFNIEDGHLTVDDDGMELAGVYAIESAAMSTFLDIARFKVVNNNERELSVSVRRGTGEPIYQASVTMKTE